MARIMFDGTETEVKLSTVDLTEEVKPSMNSVRFTMADSHVEKTTILFHYKPYVKPEPIYIKSSYGHIPCPSRLKRGRR